MNILSPHTTDAAPERAGGRLRAPTTSRQQRCAVDGCIMRATGSDSGPAPAPAPPFCRADDEDGRDMEHSPGLQNFERLAWMTLLSHRAPLKVHDSQIEIALASQERAAAQPPQTICKCLRASCVAAWVLMTRLACSGVCWMCVSGDMRFTSPATNPGVAAACVLNSKHTVHRGSNNMRSANVHEIGRLCTRTFDTHGDGDACVAKPRRGEPP
jgi:hypothetical protein